MARNITPNHFDKAAIYVEGERSIFPFKKPVQASFMSGMLVPFGDPIPVFPGVKLDLNIFASIRSNTLVVPPLDGMYVDFFTVWVPHRIVWNHQPQFLGENDTTAWTQSASYVYPYDTYVNINTIFDDFDSVADDTSVSIGNLSLFNHYGLISGYDVSTLSNLPVGNEHISMMAARGYYSIWNYLFRDENYQRPVLFSKGDTGSSGEFGYLLRDYKLSTTDNVTGPLGVNLGVGLSSKDAVLMPVNKFHDFVTSVLPQAQYGNPVQFAVSGNMAPVGIFATSSINDSALNSITNDGIANANEFKQLTGYVSGTKKGTLVADLSNVTGITVNAFRSYVMTQRYLEALARSGRRMPEYIDAIYGTKNTAAACDYPELITRARYELGVQQVIATADSSDSGWSTHLGDTGAFSLTNLRDIPCCEKDFTEFGYLHVLYCVRCNNRYSQFIQPHFLRSNILDEYNPFFDHIGEVGLKNTIVNVNAATAGNFGFQEGWFDERTQIAMATGALNKSFGSLKYWVIGEVFDSSVVSCTPGFLTFDPSVLNDVMVSSYEQYPQFIIDGVIFGKAIKRMSQHSIPGIVGRI